MSLRSGKRLNESQPSSHPIIVALNSRSRVSPFSGTGGIGNPASARTAPASRWQLAPEPRTAPLTTYGVPSHAEAEASSAASRSVVEKYGVLIC